MKLYLRGGQQQLIKIELGGAEAGIELRETPAHDLCQQGHRNKHTMYDPRDHHG